MKITTKIKFLIALSVMPLSCNKLIQSSAQEGNHLQSTDSANSNHLDQDIKDITLKRLDNDWELIRLYKEGAHVALNSVALKKLQSDLITRICLLLYQRAEHIKTVLDNDGYSLHTISLAIAIKNKWASAVKDLFEGNSPMPIVTDDHSLKSILIALLHHAIYFDCREIVPLLIKAGACPNCLYDGKRAGEHGNAAMVAVRFDRKDIVQYLIENNLIEDWHQRDKYGQKLVMIMVSTMHPKWGDSLSDLLDKGADIKEDNNDNNGKNGLMCLLERYTYIYHTYYNDYNTFTEGYKCSPNDAKTIFDRLCEDKKKMLTLICNHKDIGKIINDTDKKGHHTAIYAQAFLSEIFKRDKAEAVEICKVFLSGIFKRDKAEAVEICKVFLSEIFKRDKAEAVEICKMFLSEIFKRDKAKAVEIYKAIKQAGLNFQKRKRTRAPSPLKQVSVKRSCLGKMVYGEVAQ